MDRAIDFIELRFRIAAYREGGHTERTHNVLHHGTHSVGSHSWQMAMLLHALHPDPSKELIMAALTHDIAERWTGDTPAPVKWKLNPQVGVELKRIENAINKRLEIEFPLSETDSRWLKAVDLLELFLWCHEQLFLGNQHVKQIEVTCRSLLVAEGTPDVVRQLVDSYVHQRTDDFFAELVL